MADLSERFGAWRALLHSPGEVEAHALDQLWEEACAHDARQVSEVWGPYLASVRPRVAARGWPLPECMLEHGWDGLIVAWDLYKARVQRHEARELAQLLHLSRLERLRLALFSSVFDEPALCDGLPWPQTLRELELNSSRDAPRALTSMLRAMGQPPLEALDLRGVRAVHAEALATALERAALRRLTLGDCEGPLVVSLLRALDAWGGLAQVDALALQVASERDALIDALGELALPAITALRLSVCRMHGEHASALLRTTRWPMLATLDLSRNALGNAWCPLLEDHPSAATLRVLRLSGAGLGEGGFAGLSALGALPGVEVMDLSNNALGPLGLQALTARATPGVHTLNLEATSCFDAGLRALASSPLLASVHTLSLRACEVGDPGITALGASPHAASLHTLRLDEHTARDALSVQGLATLLSLPGLRDLDLRGRTLTRLMAEALGRADLHTLSVTCEDPAHLRAILRAPHLKHLAVPGAGARHELDATLRAWEAEGEGRHAYF